MLCIESGLLVGREIFFHSRRILLRALQWKNAVIVLFHRYLATKRNSGYRTEKTKSRKLEDTVTVFGSPLTVGLLEKWRLLIVYGSLVVSHFATVPSHISLRRSQSFSYPDIPDGRQALAKPFEIQYIVQSCLLIHKVKPYYLFNHHCSQCSR